MRDGEPQRLHLARRILPFSGLVALLALWSASVAVFRPLLIPGPWAVFLALIELLEKGLLIRYIVASLYRVTMGYLAGVALGVPLGFVLGWFRRGDKAVGPLIQVFRPISPLAWIPLSILWFGVGDAPAVFIIFLGSLFPITISAINAISNIEPVHINAGRNFGLTPYELVKKVLLPATIPQLMVGLRLALGIAWLVVVAAEMIAVNSGLGFLIVDARNAGNRYDLVVAGMLLIGATGIALDYGMRRIELMMARRWGYAPGQASRQKAAPEGAAPTLAEST